MSAAFFTARTRPESSDSLSTFRAGSTWVYADSLETFTTTVADHCTLVAATLRGQVICKSSYLATCCRQHHTLAAFERDYLIYIANVAASRGLVYKFACKTHEDEMYHCYFAREMEERVRGQLEQLWTLVEQSEVVRIKVAAGALYGDQKGAFYWAKALAEHLVHLELVSHVDQWSVRR